MNDNSPRNDLPILSDETIARIEDSVFAEIATERAPASTSAIRARARRRRWQTGGGIAAAFVIGVLVTPPILDAVGGADFSTVEESMLPGVEFDSSSSSPDLMSANAPEEILGAASDSALDAATSGDDDREIIATAEAILQVQSIPDAAAAIATLAEAHDGYVESTEISKSRLLDGNAESAPADSAYGWISVRVPSEDLNDVIAALADTGEVLSWSTTKQDVTSVSIDLQARVDSTRASVERLIELMAQSGSVSELIEAEIALTDRQAQLESYEQQLDALQDQVAMSSLQVQLTREFTATTADPAGFTDGLLAGWNGLVVSLNALVIAAGFILPWLALAGFVVLTVWLIRRARNNHRTSRASSTAKVDVDDV